MAGITTGCRFKPGNLIFSLMSDILQNLRKKKTISRKKEKKIFLNFEYKTITVQHRKTTLAWFPLRSLNSSPNFE